MTVRPEGLFGAHFFNNGPTAPVSAAEAVLQLEELRLQDGWWPVAANTLAFKAVRKPSAI